jgi:hypothetical protein
LALIKLLLDGLGNQFMDELMNEQNAQSGPAVRALPGTWWTPDTKPADVQGLLTGGL